MISRIALLSGIVVLAACRDATEPTVTRKVPLVADVVPAAGTERQITTDPHDQERAAISGDRIVWLDSRNGNNDIYMFDLATGTARQVTTDPNDQAAPAISGDRIVWQDARNGGGDIYMFDMFDLASGTERRITTTSNASSPAISADRIVWTDGRNGNFDIYMYDLATGTERQITTDPSNQIEPAISGNRIVWVDFRNGNFDIYMFDLATGTERRITAASTASSFSPAISGDRIVWTDTRNGNPDIYMFDLATVTERRITTASTASAFSSPAISGDRIVWTDTRNGNLDIYMFDLATGTERQITTNPSNQSAPVISGDRIAWKDARNGNGDTYIFDLSAAPLAITPPGTLTIPTDPGRCDAQVSLAPPTTTGGTPPVTLVASPLPPYPAGKTTVTWTATDATGSTAIATQTVAVFDPAPFAITAPLPVLLEAGPGGTASADPSRLAATLQANCPGGITVTSVRSDGLPLDAPYPLGTTGITFTATDASGYSLSASTTVTVVDTTPPSIRAPDPVVVNATSPNGAVAFFVATAYDIVAGVIPASCAPPSGSLFPIGTTTVTCTAVDEAGNASSAQSSVTVLGAQTQIADLSNSVGSLGLPSGTATSLTTKLDAALAAANAGDFATACVRLQDLINETQAQAGKKISTADAASLIAAAQRIRAVLGC